MMKSNHFASELRGGIEAAVQGMSTAITPILLFMGLFGTQALPAGMWAALVVTGFVPVVRLLLAGQPSILPAPRAASLTTYVALVLQLGLATPGAALQASGAVMTLEQLRMGLAAGSLMFLVASALVLLSGLLRIGPIFQMIPTPVSAGISTGTALLLTWLAVQQVAHSQAVAAITAAGMLLAYLGWARWQRHMPALRSVPAILVALGIGLVLAAVFEPVSVIHTPVQVGAVWQWTAVLLWPDLYPSDAVRLLAVGLPGALTLAVVMILETFTTTSVMENRFFVRTDSNRELVAVGGSNMVSALVGGVPCTDSPLYSVANWNAGGRSKLAAAITMVLMTGILLGFSNWLMALPAGLAAGLLLLQVGPMVDPVFWSRIKHMVRTRQWRSEEGLDLGFWITGVIALLAFVSNLIWATLLGVALSSLAVLKRVSLNLTAQWTELGATRSRHVRSQEDRETLSHYAHEMSFLKLDGHLFFGNSVRLRQLADELTDRTTAVAIDVRQVQDVDASGCAALLALIRTLTLRKMMVVISGLESTSSLALQHALPCLAGVEYRMDLDRAIEACEDWILGAFATDAATHTCALADNRLLKELTPEEVNAVLSLATPRQVMQGEPLFIKDDAAQGVWLLRGGQVSIITHKDGQPVRLATLNAGHFVGEMGLIDGKPRSASAHADTPVKAVQLDNDAIRTLSKQHPEAVLKITRNIARELSLRIRGAAI
jgi:SulP family sulfate permease